MRILFLVLEASNDQRLEKCVRGVLLLYNWDLRVVLADHLLQTVIT